MRAALEESRGIELQDTMGVVIVILGSLLFLEVVLGRAGALFHGYAVWSPFIPYYMFRIFATVFCMIVMRGFQTSPPR